MATEVDCGFAPADYVLGRLDDAERLAFRLHMTRCAACHEEVDLLESAADALPMMVPRQPLQRSLAEAAARRDRSSRSSYSAAALRTRAAAVEPPRRDRLARPVPRPVLAAVGALLVLAVVTVYLSARPAAGRIVHTRVDWRPGGAVIALSGRHGRLLVEGMPDPPVGDVYAIWVVHGRGPLEPTGAIFSPGEGGESTVAIPGSLSAGEYVVVTPKPLDSARPVAPAMVVAQIP
jgi:hypothetical protein